MRNAILVCLFALVLGCEQPTNPVQPPAPPNHQGCTPPKILAFHAKWCGPCQQAQPSLDWLEKQGVEVVNIDIDEQPEMARQYGVTSIPTFFVYICGKGTLRTQDVDEVVKACYWLKDKRHGTQDQTQGLPQVP